MPDNAIETEVWTVDELLSGAADAPEVSPEPEAAPEDPGPPVLKIRGRAGRKTGSTKLEYRQRIESTAILLGKRLPKHAVVKMLKDQFKVSASQAMKYIARAREQLAVWSGQSEAVHFADAAGFYKAIIESPMTDLNAKMRAQDSLVRLYALDRPSKQHIELTGAGGGPITFIEVVVAAPSVRPLEETPCLVLEAGDDHAAAGGSSEAERQGAEVQPSRGPTESME